MRVALCQLPVSSDPSVNLGRVKAAVADAAAAGANLAVFPEGMQARFGTDLAAAAEATDGAFGQGLSEAAGGHGVAVVAGVFEPAPGGRVYNTAVAFDAGGRLAAAYRKIHLFDALGHRESDQVVPGHEPVVTELNGLRVGILTCYDIRFPELARALVARGQCDLIVVPAGWAAGLFKEEHWVTLVRARAIENSVWVAARVAGSAGSGTWSTAAIHTVFSMARARTSVTQCSSLNSPPAHPAGTTIRSAPRATRARASSGNLMS